MKYLLIALLALFASEEARADSTVQAAPSTPMPSMQPVQVDPALPINNGDQIVKEFRTKYKEAKQPRLLVYINRNLVQTRGEMMSLVNVSKDTQVKGDTVATGNGVNVQVGANNNTPSPSATPSSVVTGNGGEQKDSVSLSVRFAPVEDKGVYPINDFDARQIEEVMADQFSQGGARFVDQQVANTLLKTFGQPGDRFLTAPESNAEKDEVETVKKSTDIVLEILARKRHILIPTPAGDSWQERFDLTVRAIDVRQPGLILAQVTTDTLFGFNKRDGKIREQRAKFVTSAEYVEQITLALMDRMNF